MPSLPNETAAGDDVPETAATPDYTAEVRFGVVMYGGVSLAIYINGVTNEIFEMACATPRDGVALVPSDDRPPPFTREIYRRLSWLVGNDALRQSYAVAIGTAKARAKAQDEAAARERSVPGAVFEKHDPIDAWAEVDVSGSTQTRFAVDVVAGTSAGGINGLFLAKALANGEQFSPLKDLWIDEGDIALLLNDKDSYANTTPTIAPRHAEPASLLNSDRMYAKLHYALGQMDRMAWTEYGRTRTGASPLVDEIDLFITTTDIKGSAVPLRLFDRVVYERRYKQNYHFGYPNGITAPAGDDPDDASNDFDVANRSFLAFAARCTSSFPFAFEPMTLAAVTRLNVAGEAPGVLRWNAFFPNLPRAEVARGAHVDRAFGDGGYLDNKPFSYVVDTLSHRFAAVPLERKLLFVEPSPEHLDPDDPDQIPLPGDAPDPLQNSLAALTSIPQYETIREDLQAVLLRNRRVERIERVVRLGEQSIEHGMERAEDPFLVRLTAEGRVPPWSDLKLSDMVAYYGTAFLPYLRLRMYSVTDALADRLGAMAEIDGDSDRQYALRALVRVWREQGYDDERRDGRQSLNAFLDQFDVEYRLRRIAFLLRKIDKLTRLFHKRAAGMPVLQGAQPDGQPVFSEEEVQMLAALPGRFRGLPASLSDDVVRSGENVLRVLKRGLLETRTMLQKATRDVDLLRAQGPAAASKKLDAGLRDDLNTVLLEILGQAASGTVPTVRTGIGDGKTPVVMDVASVRMASASRTLQESVVVRARAVLAAAGTTTMLPIRKWLLDRIDEMRIKPASPAPVASTEAAAPTSALYQASETAWHLLGSPRLDVEATETGTAAAGRVVLRGGDAAKDRLTTVSVADLAALNGADGRMLRDFLSRYYLRFDEYDQMSFPLYYDTDTGEPSIVEVVRISPLDATNLVDEVKDGRKKLAGTALANFGAFLDRHWRLNDIMWGQLDGAERLIQALLPTNDDATRVVRKELIERAQRSILRGALAKEGHDKVTELVVKALDETPGEGTKAERLQTLFDNLWTGNAVAQASMASVLKSLLSEPRLMDFVRYARETNPKPDPEATLKSAARAVTITGRVLQAVSRKHGAGEMPSRWMARLGLMLQGIVAVSLPGTLNQRWWTHGMKLLYAFEVVLAGLAFLFGSADMRSLAVTALATTFAIHLLTLVAGDVMRGRGPWLRRAGAGLLAGLLFFAGVGALTLAHDGGNAPFCWAHPDQIEQDDQASWICKRVGHVHQWFTVSSNDEAP